MFQSLITFTHYCILLEVLFFLHGLITADIVKGDCTIVD